MRTEQAVYAVVLLAALLACKKGGGTGGEAAPETKPGEIKPGATKPIPVTVKELNDAYQGNEVAADEKYKGKRLWAVGNVAAIEKDAFDGIVVRLAVAGTLLGVHAKMKDSEKATVAKLSKGNEIVLDCTGAGMVIGTPMLDDCGVVPKESYKK